MNNQKIPFNFTYFAMKLLGKNLYSSPWTAVSEIVANGIDAGAQNVYILIDMRNKEKAVVEIFDDGKGMSYKDLSEKYTLIGRNKRLGEDNRKGKTLGRKGIGKLAALYLSPQYFIYTKNIEEQSAWCVNTKDILDSDVPALISIDNNTDRLISKEKWSTLNTGTMIHLSDVDLRKIGPERLKSLPVMLSDYYLETTIACSIFFSIINNEGDEIEFKKIEKSINFQTMYAIFDNTGYGYKSLLKQKVYLTKNTIDKRVDIPRPTVVLNEERYCCRNKLKMTNLQGIQQEVEYNLTGWIGIHVSLDSDILKRNSENSKKVQNHPNSLRLYVRGKLAVNNLMNYVASTAAFASYIEGEISFDILDDDSFEDASTSSREGYSISDPRIKKLIEIVNKIITSLINERTKIGNQINNELKAIEEERRLAEIEAIKKAEVAEERSIKEQEKRQLAEEKVNKLQSQNNTIFSAITEEQQMFSAKTHLIKTNAISIRNNISTLANKIGVEKYREVGAIAISTDKILSSLKYSALAKFNIEDEYIQEDLFVFCNEYLENVLKKQYFNIAFEIKVVGKYYRHFNPQYITLILDNFMSNTEKSKASEVFVNMISFQGDITIEFADNGEGFIGTDLSTIFDFGYSNTGGTGIGLYNIKRAVEKMNATISAYKNEFGGATFIIKFKLEK